MVLSLAGMADTPRRAIMLFFAAFVAPFAIHWAHLLIFLWKPKAYWLAERRGQWAGRSMPGHGLASGRF